MQKNPDVIIEFIILASVVAAFFVILVFVLLAMHQKKMHNHAVRLIEIEHANEKKLYESISHTANREKERIASNLHDDVGMSINLVNQILNRQRRLLKPGTHAVILNDEATKLIGQTLEKLVSSVYELVPKYMLEFGLAKSILNELSQLGTSASLRTNFSNEGNYQFENYFDKDQVMEINRLFQEILNNIVKHAACTNLTVHIQARKDLVKILFLHDGRIITNEMADEFLSNSRGLGLKSIKVRLMILNGKINYGFEKKLASITLEIPFNSKNNEKPD